MTGEVQTVKQQQAKMWADRPKQIEGIISEIVEHSCKLLNDCIARQQIFKEAMPTADGRRLGDTFIELFTHLANRPAELFGAQLRFWQDHARLWQATTCRVLGATVEPVIAPDQGDRRFKDAAWNDNALFDFIKQSYLLSSRYVLQAVHQENDPGDKTQQKLRFYARQLVDMLAPSNFVATNPEVLRLTLETRGENLLRGLRNMLKDLDRGKGRLAIKMTTSRRSRSAGTSPRRRAGWCSRPSSCS
jgi:polyhydroxyalkanoate synthase